MTLSLVIFTLMTLMFGAVLPAAVRQARHGNNYAQAAALAQRKVDQLRTAGSGRLFDGSNFPTTSNLYTVLSWQRVASPL